MLEKTEKIKVATVSLDGKQIAAKSSQQRASVMIEMDEQLMINAGQQLTIVI